MFQGSTKVRAYAVVAILATGLASGGCGSSDDDGPEGGSSANAKGATQPTKAETTGNAGGSRHTGQAAEIDRVLQDNQADYIAGDGGAFCARLAPAGRAQVEKFGGLFGIGTACPEIIAEVSRRSSDLKQKPTKLLSVEIEGDKATAVVKDGARAPEKLAFVKHDGEWKIPDPGFPTSFGDRGSGGGPPPGAPPLPSPPGGAGGGR